MNIYKTNIILTGATNRIQSANSRSTTMKHSTNTISVMNTNVKYQRYASLYLAQTDLIRGSCCSCLSFSQNEFFLKNLCISVASLPSIIITPIARTIVISTQQRLTYFWKKIEIDVKQLNTIFLETRKTT